MADLMRPDQAGYARTRSPDDSDGFTEDIAYLRKLLSRRYRIADLDLQANQPGLCRPYEKSIGCLETLADDPRLAIDHVEITHDVGDAIVVHTNIRFLQGAIAVGFSQYGHHAHTSGRPHDAAGEGQRQRPGFRPDRYELRRVQPRERLALSVKIRIPGKWKSR